MIASRACVAFAFPVKPQPILQMTRRAHWDTVCFTASFDLA